MSEPQQIVFDHNGKKYKIDEFYKSLLFQFIMDSNFLRNERDLLLVIKRKTLHFGKVSDHLSFSWLMKATGLKRVTLRNTINTAEQKGLITIKKSKGGRIDSATKYSEYRISSTMLQYVGKEWLKIKDGEGFAESYIYE
ncbi:replication protein [Sulfurimonas sediminis]|nr:replication protein [Sulfurimonas sediminis]